ncbi:MAG TPA: putative lipid II flippase FtsW [bacterium]|nr:putative lipid II flippase FtsW [bacterium]HPN41865.1 putative lipid II flippase FtsW [bacterium]
MTNAAKQKFDISKIDYLLVFCVLLLLIIGASMVYSASSFRAEKEFGDSAHFFKNHLARVFIGLLLMGVLTVVNYRKCLGLSPIIMAGSIILLLLLFTHAPFVITRNEASRWLRLGFFTFQPSDFARYGLILILARLLYQNREELEEWKGFLKYIAFVFIIVGMVALEKDFGTAMLITLIAFCMFFFAEVKMGFLLSIGLSIVTVGLLYIKKNGYMLQRILSFFDVMLNKNLTDYQIRQSIISFNIGGLFGQGIGDSRQKYMFLPEPHKDFIFSVIGEELGLLGCIGVLLLFFMIIYRGMRIAKTAPDGYGRLLAGGITVCIGIYAFFNAAITMVLLPTTGIPMPFISYGGSAMVTHLAAVGILLNISSQSNAAFMNYPNRTVYKDRIKRLTLSFSGASGSTRYAKTEPASKYRIIR